MQETVRPCKPYPKQHPTGTIRRPVVFRCGGLSRMATYGLDRLLSNTELGLLFARLFACRSTSSLFSERPGVLFCLTGIKTALFPQTLEYSNPESSARNGGCIPYENPDLYSHRNPIFPERRTPAGPARAGNNPLPLQYGRGQRPHRLLQPWKNARIICCGCSGIPGFDFHSWQCYNRNQRCRLRLHRLRKDILFLPFEMTGRYNL